MSMILECRKMKRTGIFPAFLAGGAAAAAVPVLNMTVRPELYVSRQGNPIGILLSGNWQMMAMLNILLTASGACLMYHTEYTGNAIEKAGTLPVKEISLFGGKAAFMTLMCVILLSIEAAGVAFCAYRWFVPSTEVLSEGIKSFGYAFLLLLPAAFGALLIASACKNMWVCLGICVVCVFTATMLPTRHFILALFPFALPFQTLAETAEETARNFMAAAVIEVLIIGIAEALLLKVRRALA